MNTDDLYEFFSEINHYSLEAKVDALRKILASRDSDITTQSAELARLTPAKP